MKDSDLYLLSEKKFTIIYPNAAPREPVPSIIPTTVPIDFSLLLSYFNLPYIKKLIKGNLTRSAQDIPEIIATAPPINIPSTKI